MRVQFTVNLGERDAKVCDLKADACTAGAVLDLPEATVKQLKTLCGEAIVSDAPENKSEKPAKKSAAAAADAP